jgi:rubrerythrin
MVKENSYICVQAFMVNDLHLKGNELLIYAIIYGFSQDGESEFTGSLQYLADWTQSTKQGVMKALQGLLGKQLILKNVEYKNNLRFCTYKSTLKDNSIKQSLMGYETKFNGGIKQSLPNNTNNTLVNNNSCSTQQQFKKPTIKEIQDYCSERGNKINAEYFFDYYEAKGWIVGKVKMKDWKAVIRNWEKKNPAEAPKEKDKEYNMICDVCGHTFDFNNDWECPKCHSKKITLGEKKAG